MIGRPATEPGDPAGFDLGLDAALRNSGEDEERVGLLHLLFSARASVVSGRMAPGLLGPYLSGLLTGDEINGALSQFNRPIGDDRGDSPRADLYVQALNRRAIAADVTAPGGALCRCRTDRRGAPAA